MAMTVKVGTYVGTGAAGNAVTGVGFQPKAVLTVGTSSGLGLLAIDTMPSGNSKPLNSSGSALVTDGVTSLDADGFTLGANNFGNQSGITFYWIAWAGDVETFTYAGNSTDDRNITLASGMMPGAIMVVGDISGRYATVRTASMTTDLSAGLQAVSSSANQIQSMGTGTFQVGSGANVNFNGTTYYGIAFPAEAGVIDSLAYTGTASSHDVTGLDFEPDWVIAFPPGFTAKALRHVMQDGTTTALRVGSSTSTNAITDTIQGGFTVGTDSSANANATDFHALAFRETTPQPASLYVATGTYTGDGTDNRAITGVGFEPAVVMVKGDGVADVWRLSSMVGDTAFVGSSAFASNRVQSLDADGFTVGTDAQVNGSGTTYRWLAIGGEGVSCLTWTGTGSSRTITGVGFRPNALLVFANAFGHPILKTNDMIGSNSVPFTGGAIAGSYVSSLLPDGFGVSGHSNVNGSGTEYHAFCLAEFPDVFEAVTYVGDGTNPHAITGVGFQPDAVIVKKNGLSLPWWKSLDHGGTTSGVLQSTSANDSAHITSLDADGFTVASDTAVNQNSIAHYALAFQLSAPVVEAQQAAFDLVLGLGLDATPILVSTPAFDLVLGLDFGNDPNVTKQPVFDLLLGARLGIDPNVIKRVAFDLQLGLSLAGIDLEPVRRAAFNLVLGAGLETAPTLTPVRRPQFDLVLGLSLDALPRPIRQAALDLVLGLGLEPDPNVIRQVALDLLLGFGLESTVTIPDQTIKFDLVLGLGLDTAVSQTIIHRPAFNLVLGLDLDHLLRVTRQPKFDLWLGLRTGVRYTGPGTGVVIPVGTREQQRQRMISALRAGDSIRLFSSKSGTQGWTGISRMLTRRKTDPDPNPKFEIQFTEDSDESQDPARMVAGQTPRPVDTDTAIRELRRGRS